MTNPAYEATRTRLQAAGARPVIDIWAGVIEQRAAFLETLRGLTTDEARRRPDADAPGEQASGEETWSAVEVAQHVLSYTRNIGAIIEATAHGRTETKLPPGHLDPDLDASIEDIRHEVTVASAWLAGLAARLPDPPDLDTTVEHAAFGALNCREWLAFIQMHDGVHTAQVQALRSTAEPPEVISRTGTPRERLDAAASYDFVDLWPAVATQRAALLGALAGLNEEQARWRPATGEGEEAWGAIEVAQHLATWSRNVSDVIDALARGGTETKLPPGYIEPDPNADIQQVRAGLTTASAHFLGVVERLPAMPDLGTTVEHRTNGPMNCRAWFTMAHIHDLDHTNQIEHLKQAEGFPAGTGEA